MRFTELLARADVKVVTVRGDAEVTSVASDSRRCGRGCCFVAVRGWTDDGHKYIPPAVAGGASAVVCEDAASVPAETPCAVVTDTRDAVGRLAQALHGWPARRLVTLGVTGTNGKSTTTHLIRAILGSAGYSPALLGTITYETGRRSVDATTTTPDPIVLADMCAEMVAAGRTHLVMEVSSHALHQGRTAGLEFRVGVFTNLTGDHLDYHLKMENYLAAKRRLFEQLSPEADAVINRDRPAGKAAGDLDVDAGEEMAKATKARILWYGLSSLADLRGRIDRIDASGTRFDMIRGREAVCVSTPLIGRHNVYNCLAAAGACQAIGIDLPTIARSIATVNHVPGRLERVPSEAPFQVFVDYAHTDDALANVLSALRPVTRGRIIVVFGCGGDRDRTKRPRMARVVQEMADRIVVTSDNPRSEKPEAIIGEIVAGLSEDGRRRSEVQADRRAAIRLAIEQAREGDVVLIAGKGHERYQIVANQRHHFDDVEVAAELLGRWGAPG
jgi:UDP-N-acetylmuramoyl-L-alanyl-D-glutamate--2,6-diaminopimelate ligase